MYNLGYLAEEVGDLESAKSWYQKCADLGDSYAIEALERLQ